MVRVACVHDVQQQRRLAGLCQRGTKCRNELVRQIPHKTDGVDDQGLLRTRQRQAPHGRVERRKQQVLRRELSARAAIEQGRLAGICVADQRDGRRL